MRFSQKALFEELVKIGEDAEGYVQQPATWKRVGKGILAASLGSGLGYGGAKALEAAFPKTFSPTSDKKVLAARIALSLLGGGSFILADRYRNLMNQLSSKAPGEKK